MNQLTRWLWIVVVCGGCAGPSYSGGPEGDDPAATVIPGSDITIWAVDGQPTNAHSSAISVAPGPRVFRLRVEWAIEDDSPTPHDYREFPLRVEAGVTYRFDRKPTPRPPYEVVVSSDAHAR